MKKFFLLAICVISIYVISCHPFQYYKRITNTYYVIGVDNKDYLTISRKLKDGNYVGRVPANVVEYGVVNSFIVAKSEKEGIISYYILKTEQDHDYAQEKDFLIGPLSEESYSREWKKKLNAKLEKIN